MSKAEPAIRPGSPHPFGASWTGEGVNFAVYSAHAERVELCLFDEGVGEARETLVLPGRTGDLWHGFVPAPRARPGTLYGFRVHGPWEPAAGHRFNPCKLLLDPMSLDVVGDVWPDPALQDTDPNLPDSGPDPRDSADFVPRSRVVNPGFDWGRIRAPATPWRDTVIYELHVRGFTRQHPQVPPEWRGKYLGLTVPAVIDHLKSLGVTAVELMPCHTFVAEDFLLERGLTNYWGYNPIAWSAPSRMYAVEDPVQEFQRMVRALHEAGLEVILDVVYNHTAEGGAGGPTLSMRGLDNASWYRLLRHDARHYENHTGCGNMVDVEHPGVRAMILSSLRYWASVMRVDGFRFDLAPVLGRDAAGFSPQAPFFNALRSDPLLGYTKLIAEPWDLGPGGYQLGRFPSGWSEWNDRYRDTVRSFWRGDGGMVANLAERLAGSSDLFRGGGRRPSASINFVAAHDGFTLADLVSYNDKHNEANLEHNRDGHTDNISWNCGVEGPTDDPSVRTLRLQQVRNMLATLFLSQGVPMLQAGDELGRSQGGNNNAYCQDSALSWIDWDLDEEQRALCGFVARVIALRQARRELRRETFFKGSPVAGQSTDVAWLHPDGHLMQAEDWNDPGLKRLGMRLGTRVREGQAAPGDLLVLYSAEPQEGAFCLPGVDDAPWRVLLDTSDRREAGSMLTAGPTVLPAHCLLVLEGAPLETG